jgi:ATP-dependent RNA helicase DeaD
VIESLTSDYDIEAVALAAVKLAHEAAGGDVDEQEIPTPRETIRERPEGRDGKRSERRAGPAGAGVARLFIGLGRRAGLRPQDLVGAIAGESGLNARDIGAIQITDRFSLVEVPEAAADMVIEAMSHSTIRGRKPQVRRERYSR